MNITRKTLQDNGFIIPHTLKDDEFYCVEFEYDFSDDTCNIYYSLENDYYPPSIDTIDNHSYMNEECEEVFTQLYYFNTYDITKLDDIENRMIQLVYQEMDAYMHRILEKKVNPIKKYLNKYYRDKKLERIIND